MKYIITGKNITATAETMAENIQLLSLAEPTPKVPTPVKTRKKPVHAKECPVCNRLCKGLKGLSVHKATAHNIHSKKHAQYLKTKNKHDNVFPPAQNFFSKYK